MGFPNTCNKKFQKEIGNLRYSKAESFEESYGEKPAFSSPDATVKQWTDNSCVCQKIQIGGNQLNKIYY